MAELWEKSCQFEQLLHWVHYRNKLLKVYLRIPYHNVNMKFSHRNSLSIPKLSEIFLWS